MLYTWNGSFSLKNSINKIAEFGVVLECTELKIIGTLPGVGNLKPNLWRNHQAPVRKTHAVTQGIQAKRRSKTAKVDTLARLEFEVRHFPRKTLNY